jgi:hypothetical protein
MHGRRCGLDNLDFGVGGPGSRDGVEIWTQGSTGSGASSTAILHPGGLSMLQCTTASTFTMPAPSATYGGVNKSIQFYTTAAGVTMEIDITSGNFQTSASSTWVKITMASAAGAVNGGIYLQCIPTSSGAYYWALNGSTGVTGSGSTHIVFA